VPWIFHPCCRTWTSTSNFLHLSLFNARSTDTFLPNILISFSTASFCLVRGLPIVLFLCMVSVSTFLMLSLSALYTCPNHSILLIFIYDIILGFPYSLYRSTFFLLSEVPSSVLYLYIGPKIFQSTILSNIASLLLSLFVEEWGPCFTCICNYCSQIAFIEQSFWPSW